MRAKKKKPFDSLRHSVESVTLSIETDRTFNSSFESSRFEMKALRDDAVAYRTGELRK
jgi:uncharacterized FlgJ-related protein